ncbi:MAG: esterase family protein [Lachnospira sp.]|nr:esterase family protein [Lachnospira sp.]
MAHLSINCRSKVLGMPVMLDVLMPQRKGNYKVLYLLHGAGGDHTTWLYKSRIADYMEKTDIAVIMPSGNNRFYVNNEHGKKYFTYITEELPKMCEEIFNISCDAKDRFIAGMSMGGYGAFYAALKCPGMYAGAFSYSGALDIGAMYERLSKKDMFAVFGTRQQLDEGDYDLKKLVNKQGANDVDKFTEFNIACGEEDALLPYNREFYDYMKCAGYNVTYEESPGGHDSEYWDKQVEKTVERIKLW